jgi:hypothetical protein
MNQIKEINDTRDKTEQTLTRKLQTVQQELDTVNGEFNLKMQKIKLMELELEAKIMADAGERKLKDDKLFSLEKEVNMLTSLKGKLERKVAS